MTFTEVTGSVPVQPGVGCYNFIASGAITKGQAVCLCPGLDERVLVTPNSSQIAIGVAAYSVDDGERIAIYGPMNIVQCKLSGTQAAGTLVGGMDGGLFTNTQVAAYKVGIVTKGVTTTGDGEVLLLGRI